MNSRKVKEIAKKRLQHLFSSNKGNDKGEFSKIKWDINKEFNLSFHDKSSSEADIILNPETFQGIQENDFIEIISTSNNDLRILFKIKKQNIDKIKTSISILSVYNELLKNQNENYNKSTVYVRPANINDYFVDKITILFKEHFISRKDIFQMTQSLIDKTVYMNKDIRLIPNPDNDEIPIAQVVSFKGTKLKIPLTGLVTSSTDFQLRSSSSGMFYLVEISKNTYDFSINSKTKFEMIIEFLKNTMQKLKKSRCSHIINIVFFTRIYFQKKENRKLFKKKSNYNSTYNDYVGDYIYQSIMFPNEYFFDIYSNILKVNISKLDIIEMMNVLYKAFNAFAYIFEVNNLSEYMNELKNNFDINLNLIYSKSQNENNINLNKNNVLHFNNMYSPKFFEDVENFRMTNSCSSNIFEAINVIINDLKYEKKKLYKLGNIISVICSGEYFPYYNYRLSKITKENLFEQGIPFLMVFLTTPNKTLEIYKQESSISYEREMDSPFYKDERQDRDPSFYSMKGINIHENIRLTIAKNNDILDSLNENKCLRKNSLDNVHKDNLSIPNYKFAPDILTHSVPKWMKVFFVTSYSDFSNSLSNLLDGKNKIYKESQPNILPYQIFSSSSNYMKPGRKMSFINYAESTHYIPDDIDHDIFNAKKKTIVEIKNNKIEEFNEDYENLVTEDIRKRSLVISNKNENNMEIEISNLNLNNLKDKLNIYKQAYLKSKNSKTEEKEEEYSISNSDSPTKKTQSRVTNEYTKTEEFKELIKKANEYANEIFVKKVSRRSSNNRLKLEKHKSQDKRSTCRDILHSFEFNETQDDFSMLIELLTQVPLLPLFGEFDTHDFKEDVSMAPHQLSSLNSEYNILEEIIFERINNNYQIIKPKSHHEDYNKVLDLKTIESIQLFDRRFYHHILVEDQNYKVQIYNYSKKLNKYANSTNNLTYELRYSMQYESEFNYLDYNYFVYDHKVNMLAGKRMSTKLGEKNEVFWSKYDIWLNDLQVNMKQIRFKNESNFLIVDRIEELKSKKKTKNYSNISYIQNNNYNSENGYSSQLNSHPKTPTNKDEIINSVSSQCNSPRISAVAYVKFQQTFSDHNLTNFNSSTNSVNENNNPLNNIDESFKDRFKNYILSVENYLTKYSHPNIKFSDKILYLDKTQQNNNLIYSLVVINNGVDWILFIHNQYFNERNALFISIRYLSCNSITVNNFHKDLARKSRNKNLGLIKIPCDEIVISNFKRISLWKLNYTSKVKILDKILSEGIFNNFLRCEYDNNIIYFNEDLNLLCKISQRGFVFLHDEIIEHWNDYQSCFLDYALSLDRTLDVFDFMNGLLDKIEK